MSVEEVFASILRDPTHTSIRTLERESIPERGFAHWSMGFVDLGSATRDGESQVGWKKLASGKDAASRAKRYLQIFQADLLSGACGQRPEGGAMTGRSRATWMLLGAVLSAVRAEVRPAIAQEPLPFLRVHDVVLFQGDSITDGGRQRTGSDYNHIMGQDYGYVLAAEIGAASPKRDLVFVNRGISGNRVPDLEVRWQADTIALHPQLLSILIGVNDLTSSVRTGTTAEQFEAGYDALLAETVAALPATKIVLCEPFMLPVGKLIEGYAEQMVELKKRQAAVDRLGAKYHLPVVEFQASFDAALKKAPADHWSWDGIHPTYAGHGLMAQEWLKAVDGFWPK